MPSSSSSSLPQNSEQPYDPFGPVATNGKWVGPKYGSAAESCDLCEESTPPAFCEDRGNGEHCGADYAQGACYEGDELENGGNESDVGGDPASGGGGSGGSGPTNSSGGALMFPISSQEVGNYFGNLVDTTPNKPAQVTTPNTLGGEAAWVRPGIGQVYMVEIDLARDDAEFGSSEWGMAHTPGGREYSMFPWGQTRSYANIEGPDDGGINGNRWLNKELGYLDFLGAPAGTNDPDRIVRRGLTNQSLWFEKNSSTGKYAPLTAFYGSLSHNASGETFAFTDDDGQQWEYYDNSLSHTAELRGKLKGLMVTTQVVEAIKN